MSEKMVLVRADWLLHGLRPCVCYPKCEPTRTLIDAASGPSHSCLVPVSGDYLVLHQPAGNLLARIHRDGGHHEERVGYEQACIDAEEAVLDMRSKLEALSAPNFVYVRAGWRCTECGKLDRYSDLPCPVHSSVEEVYRKVGVPPEKIV